MKADSESSPSLVTHSVNPLHCSSLPPRLSTSASDRLLSLSIRIGPHSFRLSPGDRGLEGRIPGASHPPSSTPKSDWLAWVPVTTTSTVDWPSDRRSARRRFRPRRVFVVGLRSRRSRRKRQDNGDPGRRVRLPIQRCARCSTDGQGRGSDGRAATALPDETAQGGARGFNGACPG